MDSNQNLDPRLVLAKKIGKSMANFLRWFAIMIMLGCVTLTFDTLKYDEATSILAPIWFLCLFVALFWGARWMTLRDREEKQKE